MDYSVQLQFDSSLENIVDVNDSFSSGVLKICYSGRNRNGSMISRQSIERAIPSMYNCPVVCNYDVESNTIGGHDMDIVTDNDGNMKLIHVTDAVGVIPMNANSWWSAIEDDGVQHDYFFTEAILWKRSPVYEKLINDGIVAQSMEISVKSGAMKDGVFVIEDFIFTAFCLLGDDVTPCFESAALQLFDKNSVSKQFSIMMQELKEMVSMSQPQQEVVIQEKLLKGGREALEQKYELLAKYGFTEDNIDFNLEEITVEDLEFTLEELKALDTNSDPVISDTYALTEQFREELLCALSSEKIETCFGEMNRYYYFDYDAEASEVYCHDSEDWKLYGFAYSMNGDSVIVDFESKKRKKFAIVDFDEGEQPAFFAEIFSNAVSKFETNDSQWAEKYEGASATISAMEVELGELRQFKSEIDNAAAKAERDDLFSRFEDLVGVEAFENLRSNCDEMSLEDIEERCFAIRGRNSGSLSFSQKPQGAPKLKVDFGSSVESEPYGGAFVEYGIE